jgi:AraC family transcriptional regulator
VENLKTGRFYGQTNSTTHLDFATITDTEYTHDKVDWHYHDNAYFTFILQGDVIEGNKKEVYNCSAGSLLFHNWHDPHYNIKPKGFTRGFHIEIDKQWFDDVALPGNDLHGSFAVDDPDIKLLFYSLFKESKVDDALTALSAEALLLQVLSKMQNDRARLQNKAPLWVDKLRCFLADDVAHKFTLVELSTIAQIHPVHLSRDFSRYFGCNLGEYIRKLRIARAFTLLPDQNLSLTDIALSCGFADQSHFLRSFKSLKQVKPTVYRKLLLRAR